MKTLIIPDIHNHWREAEAAIGRHPADQVVFLGDYFDSFHDTVGRTKETARWLKDSLQYSNRIHLWGNHDLWYAYPKHREIFMTGCGFTPQKLECITSILNRDDFSRLKLVHFVEGIACSHAGIAESIFAHPIQGLSEEIVEAKCVKAMEHAAANIGDAVFNIYQGVTWIRFDVLPVLDAFSQIVGHTPDYNARVSRNSQGRYNVCLDTMGNWVGVVEEGELTLLSATSSSSHEVRFREMH
jgi:hypothetical protein